LRSIIKPDKKGITLGRTERALAQRRMGIRTKDITTPPLAPTPMGNEKAMRCPLHRRHVIKKGVMNETTVRCTSGVMVHCMAYRLPRARRHAYTVGYLWVIESASTSGVNISLETRLDMHQKWLTRVANPEYVLPSR
jgi:hypothetical protein